MKSNDNYYGSIDFLRIIFCICVIVGHVNVCFYTPNGTEDMLTMQNMSVDAFFMIAGIFIAKSCERLLLCSKDEIIEKMFLKYQYKRIGKLYPLYIITSILYIVLNILQKKMQLTDAIDCWPIFFFWGQINGFPNIGIVWYVCSLVWIEAILSACLLFWKRKSIVFLFPVFIFLSFSYMYACYGNLSLNAYPLMENWFSAGNIKALCAIAVGIEAYYIAEYIKKNQIVMNEMIYTCAEFVTLAGIAYCFRMGGVKEA